MNDEYRPKGLTQASRDKMQRRLCAVVLTFEGLVVFFGALAASRLSDDVSSGTAILVGGLLALACILASGMLRSPAGIPVGYALQVVVLLTGFVVPAMFVMGVVFGALWVSALRIGALVANPPG